MSDDKIDHPSHYNQHPSGIEAIDVCEHMNFCLGNAIKYIWRADFKGDDIEDLKKAIWYLNREIKRRSGCPLDVDKRNAVTEVLSPPVLRNKTAGRD